MNAALERAGWGQQEQVTSVSPSVSPAISGTSHLIGENLLGTSKSGKKGMYLLTSKNYLTDLKFLSPLRI